MHLLTAARPISWDRPRVNVEKALLWSLLDRSAGQVIGHGAGEKLQTSVSPLPMQVVITRKNLKYQT